MFGLKRKAGWPIAEQVEIIQELQRKSEKEEEGEETWESQGDKRKQEIKRYRVIWQSLGKKYGLI